MSNTPSQDTSQSNILLDGKAHSLEESQASVVDRKFSYLAGQISSQTAPTMEVHRSYVPLPQTSFGPSYETSSLPLHVNREETAIHYNQQSRHPLPGPLSRFQPASAALPHTGLPPQATNYSSQLPSQQAQLSQQPYANINALNLGAAPRQRSSIACTHCRKRKIRCMPEPGVGNRCTNCIRLGKDCHYEPVSKENSGGTPSSVASSPHQMYNTFAQGQNTSPVFSNTAGSQWSQEYHQPYSNDPSFQLGSTAAGLPLQGRLGGHDYSHELSRRLPGLPTGTPSAMSPTAQSPVVRSQYGYPEMRGTTLPYTSIDPQARYVQQHYHQKQHPILPSQPSSPGLPSYAPGHNPSYASLPAITTTTRPGQLSYDPTTASRSPLESHREDNLTNQLQNIRTSPQTQGQVSYNTTQQGPTLSPNSGNTRSALDSNMVQKLGQARR